MMKLLYILPLTFGAALTASLTLQAEERQTAPGPLADYVARPDASFGWVKRAEGKLGSGQYIELTLTSQTWRTVVWRHQLFIYKPAKLTHPRQAMLLIEGGAWNEKLADPAAQTAPPALLDRLGDALGSPVAIVRQVPQQPMFGGLVEDQLIALTFANYLLTRDPEWPLLLPMVKSAVRAMDAVQHATEQEWELKVDHFTVMGASKRGWTTWLTAAVDPRVTALAPMVIDMLNMRPQMDHQVASFGKFSEQLGDYTSRNLQRALDTAAGKQLQSIVDPYSYRKYITQPKLILLGSNDRYWPADALNLYWDGLQGQKHVLYIPNSGHALRDYPRMLGAVAALHHQAAGGDPLPKLDWEFGEEAGQQTLTITADENPRSVHVWVATSSTRDFRDSRWEQRELVRNGEAFVYRFRLPQQGFVAQFGEAVFGGENQRIPIHLSTTVQIFGRERQIIAGSAPH